MGKTLVIAEKPSVARDIAGVLGVSGSGHGVIENDDYVISWAIGHLVGIAAPEKQAEEWGGHWSLETLPMIPKTLVQEPNQKTLDQFKVLKGLLTSSDVDNVVCATDAAREGVHIFQRIYTEAGSDKPYKYLWASDMTHEGLSKAFANLLPASDKAGVSDAGFARSEADWLVGMNFTRLYTVKCNDLVSIGRVQTPVLKMLVDRGLEIKNFKPSPYFQISGHFVAGTDEFEATWYADPFSADDKKTDEATAQAVADRCIGKPGQVDFVESKPATKKAPLPFDLTTLQKEANNKFGFTAQDTLTICQALYETHKVLTYPRTDSRHLSEELLGEIAKHFAAAATNYADLAEAAQNRVEEGNKFACVNNAKITDHHAIIPTGQAADRSKLSDKEWKIYDLATRRFLAAFLPDAKLENSVLWITIGEDRFKATGQVYLDSGWMVAEPWRSAEDKTLPKLVVEETVDVSAIKPEKKMTKAPAQFTEASILTAMETAGKGVEDDELAEALKERGLGTPATRANIIETLIKRGYVERNKKNLVATNKGIQVIESVDSLHPNLSSPELTGDWEKRLRDMEAGNLSLDHFLNDIRAFVAEGIDQGKAGKVAYQGTGRGDRPELGPCPLCGKPVVENKKAFGCTGYPECKFYIWKEMFKGKITAATVKQLLTKGQTSKEIKFHSEKKNKDFQAKLKLLNEPEGERKKGDVVFVFDQSQKPKGKRQKSK